MNLIILNLELLKPNDRLGERPDTAVETFGLLQHAERGVTAAGRFNFSEDGLGAGVRRSGTALAVRGGVAWVGGGGGRGGGDGPGRGGTGLTRAVPRARELGLRPVADHVGNLVRQALPQLL